MAESNAVIKKDFMVKRSLMKGRLIKNENYKSRWFILTQNSLSYYDGTLQDGLGRLKGDIQLRLLTTVEEVTDEALNRPNVFQVAYRPNYEDEPITLYIQAVHEDQRAEWIKALKKVCLEIVADIDPMYHPGVWRSNKYTCCDSINKKDHGCTKATPLVDASCAKPPITAKSGAAPINQISNNQQKVPPKGVQMPGLPPKAGGPSADTTRELTPKPRSDALPVPKPRAKPAQKLVLALYEFNAIQPTDLSLVKGEEYVLLEEDGNWMKLKNSEGHQGYAPSNYVSVLESGSSNAGNQLTQYEWYYGDTQLARAEELLSEDGTEGCFIVRDSRKAGMYSLSVYTKTILKKNGEGSVKHYHIRKSDDGKFFVAESYAFATLPELIVFHKQDAHGLVVKLKHPPSSKMRTSTLMPVGLGHDAKEILLSELTLMDEIGSGQFGKVMRGKYRGTIDVAVKMLKEGTMSESDFLAEAVTMTKLKHKNLVQLYGVCSQAKPIYIITEFIKHGSLLGFLRRNRHKLLDETTKLLDMAIQVCTAMVYLESMTVIHRDLAARNCLVGENNSVKVSDFGLTRFITDDEYTIKAGTKFPVKWSAPEVILQSIYSHKSDIWSFGVLLWEIFTGGEAPYSSIQQNQLVDMICSRNKRLPQPPKSPDSVFRIMSACWAQGPDNRPTFVQLLSKLESTSESI